MIICASSGTKAHEEDAVTSVFLTKRPMIAVIVFFISCILAASFTELLNLLSSSQLSIWLPTGILLAVLVLSPLNKWPIWVLAAVVAELAGNFLWYGHHLGPALLLAVGNASSAAVSAYVLRRVINGYSYLDNVKHATIFSAVVIGLLPLISATIGSVALGWSYNEAPFDAWGRLILGDSTGAILSAPAAIVFLMTTKFHLQLTSNRKFEAFGLVLVFLTVAAVSLGGFIPYTFLIIPLLLWAALRFRVIGAVIASCALTVITAAFTFAGISPFAQDPVSTGFQFEGLQLFLLVASTTSLLIGAIAEENRDGLQQLYLANQTLEDRVLERSERLAASEAKARETASLLSAISEACPDLIFAKDLERKLIYANNATLNVLGAKCVEEVADQGEQHFYAVENQFDPVRQNDERVITTQQIVVAEETVTTRHGDMRVYLSTKAPLYNSDGNLSGLAGVSVDITDMKKSQAREVMLMREVEHRSRNLLAVVHGIIQLTKADTVAELKDKLGKRISALARTNGAIVASQGTGASLSKIIKEELAPYQDDQDQRVTVSGPDIFLDPATAQSCTLAVHELTTNAAKYGSLSTAAGRLEISWNVSQYAKDKSLIELDWRECGGPAVAEPERLGFGSTVIKALGDEQPGASVQFMWKPEGLELKLKIVIAAPDPVPGTDMAALHGDG